MLSVRQKVGPAVRRVLGPVHGCHSNWLAAGGWHSIDRFVDKRREENHISRPRSPSPVGRRRQVQRRTASELQSFELLISKEADGFSVGRPKGEFATLRIR